MCLMQEIEVTATLVQISVWFYFVLHRLRKGNSNTQHNTTKDKYKAIITIYNGVRQSTAPTDKIKHSYLIWEFEASHSVYTNIQHIFSASFESVNKTRVSVGWSHYDIKSFLHQSVAQRYIWNIRLSEITLSMSLLWSDSYCWRQIFMHVHKEKLQIKEK